MNSAVALAMSAMTAAHPTRSTDREADERFFHFKDVDLELPNGRIIRNVTCFTRKDKTDGKYYASFAECDDRDQFCKRTGRTVARRKWFRSPSKRLVVAPEGLNYETLRVKWEEEYMGVAA